MGETAATRELRALDAAFERELIHLTDRVFVAAGYGMSTFAFVVGETGIVAVDAGATPAATAEALGELRRHSDLPILGLVYTHHHFDHLLGAVALAEENPGIEIWGIEPFANEAARLMPVRKIARRRTFRQFGLRLPPELHISTGIASAEQARQFAFWDNSDPRIRVTRWVTGTATVELGGVRLQVSRNPGETDDQALVWFPEERVAFTGDNMYRSWPNLYAIRGTPCRDVRGWCESIDRIRALEPAHLVLGHTRPISGAGAADEALGVYSRALWHVYNATVEGMNAGRTPDDLVHEVRLPDDLADHPLLREYYGTVAWSVRGIFDGVLGWFDGNPTNLNPLPVAERARRIAELAGGAGILLERARAALAGGEAQWAAELCDILLALDFRAADVTALKADALDELAYNLVNATGRNYLHAYAQELRESLEAGA